MDGKDKDEDKAKGGKAPEESSGDEEDAARRTEERTADEGEETNDQGFPMSGKSSPKDKADKG